MNIERVLITGEIPNSCLSCPICHEILQECKVMGSGEGQRISDKAIEKDIRDKRCPLIEQTDYNTRLILDHDFSDGNFRV